MTYDFKLSLSDWMSKAHDNYETDNLLTIAVVKDHLYAWQEEKRENTPIVWI